MLLAPPAPSGIDAALVPIGDAAEAEALRLIAELRRAGLVCDMGFRGNLKRRMQKAGASGARYAIILGDDELARGQAAVKDLQRGVQDEVPLAEISGHLQKMLGFDMIEGWSEALNPGTGAAVGQTLRSGSGRIGFLSEPEGGPGKK
jgi:histidyl-tRNA synthetase